jgi:hydroxymethylpyrimidine pyrophosphatase-like HAD family hydrolase
MIQLLATDLDRTLLRGDKSVSDYTVRVLTQCRARGIKIAFATARSEAASARFSARFAPDIFISNGGALRFCRRHRLRRLQTPIPSAAATKPTAWPGG